MMNRVALSARARARINGSCSSEHKRMDAHLKKRQCRNYDIFYNNKNIIFIIMIYQRIFFSYVVEMRFHTMELLLDVRKVQLLFADVCICVIIHRDLINIHLTLINMELSLLNMQYVSSYLTAHCNLESK